MGRRGITCEQGESSSDASHQGGVEGIPDREAKGEPDQEDGTY